MTAVIDFNKPDAAAAVGGELETQTAALVSGLATGPIRDAAALELAAADRKAIGDAIARVEAFFAPLKKMAYDLHKTLCNRENAILGPMRRVDQERRDAIAEFKAADDRRRAAEERELVAQQTREAEARAVSEAANLEADGAPELAAAVLHEALTASPPVVVLPDATRAAGIRFTRRWLWRIAGGDEARALRLVPREYLKLDTTKINGYVRHMKGSAKIPGLDIYYVDDPIR